jgi:hypothetical protein
VLSCSKVGVVVLLLSSSTSRRATLFFLRLTTYPFSPYVGRHALEGVVQVGATLVGQVTLLAVKLLLPCDCGTTFTTAASSLKDELAECKRTFPVASSCVARSRRKITCTAKTPGGGTAATSAAVEDVVALDGGEGGGDTTHDKENESWEEDVGEHPNGMRDGLCLCTICACACFDSKNKRLWIRCWIAEVLCAQ